MELPRVAAGNFAEFFTHISEHFRGYFRLHWADHPDLGISGKTFSSCRTLMSTDANFGQSWWHQNVKQRSSSSRPVTGGAGVNGLMLLPQDPRILEHQFSRLTAQPANRILYCLTWCSLQHEHKQTHNGSNNARHSSTSRKKGLFIFCLCLCQVRTCCCRHKHNSAILFCCIEEVWNQK